MPVNYQKSKFYKLVCDDMEKMWIGATTKQLCQRMAQHRDAYKNYINGKNSYCPSFEILSGKNARIELLETFPCNDKDELNKRLHELIKSNPTSNNNSKKEQPTEQPTEPEEVTPVTITNETG